VIGKTGDTDKKHQNQQTRKPPVLFHVVFGNEPYNDRYGKVCKRADRIERLGPNPDVGALTH
jgi:hypothetical protein